MLLHFRTIAYFRTHMRICWNVAIEIPLCMGNKKYDTDYYPWNQQSILHLQNSINKTHTHTHRLLHGQIINLPLCAPLILRMYTMPLFWNCKSFKKSYLIFLIYQTLHSISQWVQKMFINSIIYKILYSIKSKQ